MGSYCLTHTYDRSPVTIMETRSWVLLRAQTPVLSTQWPNMKRVCRTENKNTKRDENQKEKEATNKTRMDARSHHKKEDKTTSENAVSKHLSCYNSSLIQTCPDTAMVS